MSQYDLNLRDYWRILRKRKWLVGLVTLAFGAMAFTFAEMQRPVPIYQTTAVVKFERTTTLVGLLVESISISQGDNMATQAAVVRSFPVLERAAKIMRVIPTDLDSDAVKRNPRYIQLISDLRTQVTATPEENTTLIDITVKGLDSIQVTRAANAIAQAYQEENRVTRNHQVLEARHFIEEQLTEVGGRLRTAEDGIRALKERRGFVSLPEETSALLTRQSALEGEYEKLRQTQQETANQIQALQDPQVVAGAMPPRIFTDAGDPTIAKLNATLLDLGVERENLLTTLTPAHPQIQELSARIATARENLIRELRLKSQTFQGRIADLHRQIQQLQQQQRSLPDVALQYAQLQRDMTINENLLTQLRTKFQEVQIKEKEQVEEVSLVRPAIQPTAPMNPPQTSGKGIVGILIGLTVGLVLAFVMESLDTSIGTIQDVESYLEVPVLGLIPNIDVAKDPLLAPRGGKEEDPLRNMRPFLICLLSPHSTLTEAYRSLRTNIEFLSLEKSVKTLSLTSASLMEGKTTTAINLAISLAQMGKKTLLVEADLRKPFLHHAFGLQRDPGLAEVIVGNKEWKECVRTVADLMLGPLGVEHVMNAPNIDKLYLLTSGTPPPNPTEFLNSQRMVDLIQAFRQEFDIIIFDCPPILPVTDAAILASKVDGTVIVYRAGKIARSALRRAKALLENVRGKVLGVVLTGLRAEISPDFEQLEYYRYAYGQEPGRPSATSDARRPASRLGRVAGLLAKISSRGKVLLLIPFGLILVGSWVMSREARAWEWLRPFHPWTMVASATGRHPIGLRGTDVPLPKTEVVVVDSQCPALPTPSPLVAPLAAAPGPPGDPAIVRPANPSPRATALIPADHGPVGAETSALTPFAAVHSYSLQVASYQMRDRSLNHVQGLKREGLDAFTIPVQIPGRGRFYRVMVGRFDSVSGAKAAAQRLRSNGKISEYAVQSLPFAVEVAGITRTHQAAEVAAAARRSGYFPVIRSAGGAAPAGSTRTLLAEAFVTPEDAGHLADRLRT
jgi:polysaccharide biosynthesis transport protein